MLMLAKLVIKNAVIIAGGTSGGGNAIVIESDIMNGGALTLLEEIRGWEHQKRMQRLVWKYN